MSRRSQLPPVVAGVGLGLLVMGTAALAQRAPATAPTDAVTPAVAPRGLAEVAASSASSAAPAPPPAPARDCVVAAIGDSLTDPKSHGGGYLKVLVERHPGLRVDNYGKGGNMVNQMRRRFARDVLGEPADPERPKPSYTHLVVFGGVNDLLSDQTAGRTPRKVSADLSHMYARARERGMTVVAVTVSPWSGFRKWWNEQRGAATLKLNDWIREREGSGEVQHVVDAWALLSCGVPTALCKDYVKPFNDGLHFGPKGHAKLGEAMSAQAFSDCR